MLIRDLELALASLSYISSPLDVGEVEILKQRATNIQRCGDTHLSCIIISSLRLNQFEQSKMSATASLGRSGVSKMSQNTELSREFAPHQNTGGGEDTITCFKCNIMTSNYQVTPYHHLDNVINDQSHQECPGGQSVAFPGSRACRLLALRYEILHLIV